MYTKIILNILLLLSFFYSYCQLNDPDWKLKTHSPIYGSVATADDMLYFGNEAGELYAVTSKGSVKWMVNLNGAIKSTPSISGKSLIINTSTGLLYAINTKNGKEIWKRKIGSEKRYDLWDYYYSSPVVDDNRIYLGLGDGSVQCFDLDSGKPIWKYQTGDVVHATPLIAGSLLYIGGFDGFLYKFNKMNGDLEWKFDTKGTDNYPKGEIQKSALVSGDKVYVTCRGNFLYELDAETGKELRNYFESGSWIIATPTQVGGGLFFGTSDTQAIRKIPLTDFKPEWSTIVSMRVYSKIAEYNGSLYFGTFDGKVFELSTSGEVKATYQSEVSKKNYSLIYGDNGYFRKDIFTLYGSNMPAAEKLLLTLGGFASDPIIVENKLFISDVEGTLFSFKLE